MNFRRKRDKKRLRFFIFQPLSFTYFFWIQQRLVTLKESIMRIDEFFNRSLCKFIPRDST